MSPRSSASVSNSLAARASSSSTSGSTFSLTSLDGDLDRASRSRRRARSATSCVSPRRRRRAPTRSPRRGGPTPSSTTVSRCASPFGADEVDDERVALLRGPVVGGDELGDRLAQRLELRVARAPPAPRPRRAAPRASSSRRSRGVGCTSTVAVKLHGSSRVLGSSNSYSGVGDRAEARAARRRAPEPAADVAVDGLGVDPVLAECARRAPGVGIFPLRKPGILTVSERSRRRVLDRVLDLVRARRRP